MEQTRPDDVAPVVRAHRFELVDQKGRVRAVLGDIGTPDAFAPGLVLLDRRGRQRSWLALFAFGPMLCFEVDGNEVLNLGVSDDEAGDDDPDYDPVAFVMFADGDGERRIGLRVHYDGTVAVE